MKLYKEIQRFYFDSDMEAIYTPLPVGILTYDQQLNH
jgi:hypothetical protein